MCDSCEGSLEEGANECHYWLHEIVYYSSRFIQTQHYCEDCTKVFSLFDGRKECVCPKCQKYVEHFLKKPALLGFYLRIPNEDRKEYLKEKFLELQEDNILLFVKFLENPNQVIDDNIITETTNLLFAKRGDGWGIK